MSLNMEKRSITINYKDGTTKEIIDVLEIFKIRDDLKNMVLLELNNKNIASIHIKNFDFSRLFSQRRLRIKTTNPLQTDLIL